MPTIWVPRSKYRPVHAARLARWYGDAAVERISFAMRNWYGPPIPLTHIPGRVLATGGGDFVGRMMGRYEAAFYANWARARATLQCERGGFSSLSDLISEGTAAGKRRKFLFRKAGTTGVVGVSNSLLLLGNVPVACANAPAAPGGEAPTDATTGFIPFTNPTNPDTLHIVGANGKASVVDNSLLLYDCLFRVNKTMNSTATEAVTGVPTRYQSITGGAADSAEGNFLFVQVGLTALAATAHNWATCLYTDQGGTAGVTLPTITGNASAIVHRLDHPVNDWYAPLAAGDTGIKALTQMQCSAAVATGVINFVIGHPIAWMMFPVANALIPFDYINTAFNLERIFDDAALALLEVIKPATGATTYNVEALAVAG